MNPSLALAVRSATACSVLSEDERTALSAAGRTRNLKRGETLFFAGDEKRPAPPDRVKVTSTALATDEQFRPGSSADFVGGVFQPFAQCAP
jgi:CRP/FNR family transcriptional regulator